MEESQGPDTVDDISSLLSLGNVRITLTELTGILYAIIHKN